MRAQRLSLSEHASAENRLTFGFVAVALLAAVLYRAWPASSFWIPLALAGIAIAIWHGAFDIVVADTLLEPRFGTAWRVPFALAYSMLAIAVVAVWFAFPAGALVAFLLYSAYHFGTEADHGSSAVQQVSAAAMGFVPIAAACRWKADQVIPIFATMMRGRVGLATALTVLAGEALVPVILLGLFPKIHRRQELTRLLSTLSAELLLFRTCPPVLAFAIFFCALHTPQHLVEASRDSAGEVDRALLKRNLKEGALPWLLTIAALTGVAWFGKHTVEADVSLVFIGLSALTVPHMLLAMVGRFKMSPRMQRTSTLEGLVNG